MTVSIKTLRIMIFSIKALSIESLFKTLSMNKSV
jgi:hypothetical protein